jgi:hypothetical protein
MARCDEGYPCEVCDQDVEDVTVSDLYLRFVMGEVPIDRIHRLPERHIRCNPALAQYIVDASFPNVQCEGPFDKRQLDGEFVKAEEARISRAWRRLQMLPTLGLPIHEYPILDRIT